MEDRVYRRRWWTLLVLVLSLVVVGLDNLVLNVALPTIQRGLQASASELQWTVDAYALVFAALLLGTGSLGDRYGRKLVLNLGLIIFAVGSLGAALAGSAGVLIGWRAVMGLGAALLMPSTLAILVTVFPPAERARAIAVWAGAAALAIPLGPVVGGFLLAHFNWNSVFLINPPIVLIALIAGAFLVPESRSPAGTPPDILAMVLSTGGLAAIVYGLIEGPTNGWTSGVTLGGLALGVLLLGVLVAWEIRSPHPMLPMGYFRNPRFSVAAVAVVVLTFGLFGALFLLTQYLQFVRGYSALQAGLRILPVAIILLAAPLATVVMERIGSKLVVAAGLMIVALGLFLMSRFGAGTSDVYILLTIGVSGLGMGTTMAPAADALIGAVPPAKAGVGSGTQQTALQLGGALGVAVLGSLVNSSYQGHVRPVATHLPPPLASAAIGSVGAAVQIGQHVGGVAGLQLASVARSAFVSAMNDALLVAVGVALAGALVVLAVLPARSVVPAETTAFATGEQVGAGAAHGDGEGG